MSRLNRDTVIAILLLLASGVLMVASFDIREPDYGQLSPAAWPRAIVIALAVLSFIYLIQAVTTAGADLTAATEETASPEQVKNEGRIAGFFTYWRNVIWCFALFLAYLLSLPVLGMLIGGVLFAFLLLSALGGWQPKQLGLHALIALVAVGGIWALFTFGLKVPLPPGDILPRF
ncbi:MAG: tripartite tricarboxylate transporter TctB family protein [Geminicoccaceae bacterium]